MSKPEWKVVPVVLTEAMHARLDNELAKGRTVEAVIFADRLSREAFQARVGNPFREPE